MSEKMDRFAASRPRPLLVFVFRSAVHVRVGGRIGFWGKVVGVSDWHRMDWRLRLDEGNWDGRLGSDRLG